MEHGNNTTLLNCLRRSTTEHIDLVEGNRTGVLHSARVEVWSHDLVVLLERVWSAEGLLEELETGTSDVEQVVVV